MQAISGSLAERELNYYLSDFILHDFPKELKHAFSIAKATHYYNNKRKSPSKLEQLLSSRTVFRRFSVRILSAISDMVTEVLRRDSQLR
jgi:TRAP-type mannitol/chloroaromatic compound transport system substrate-binding protein